MWLNDCYFCTCCNEPRATFKEKSGIPFPNFSCIVLLCLNWFNQSWVMRFLNGNLVVLSDLMAVLIFLIRNETFLFIFLYVRLSGLIFIESRFLLIFLYVQLYALIFIESCFSDVIDGQVMVFYFFRL